MKGINKSFFKDYERIKALLLSFVGGILNMFCKDNFGFYSTMQTNNTVTFVENMIEGKLSVAVSYLFMIFFFLIGLFLACLDEKRHGKSSQKRLCLINALLLFAIIFAPIDSSHETFSIFEVVCAVAICFVSAFMLHSFVSANKTPYASTMMTANYNRFVSAFFAKISAKGEEKSKTESERSADAETVERKGSALSYPVFLYVFIILAFMAGVAVAHLYLVRINIKDNYWGYVLKNMILLLPVILMLILFICEGGERTGKVDAQRGGIGICKVDAQRGGRGTHKVEGLSVGSGTCKVDAQRGGSGTCKVDAQSIGDVNDLG